MDKLMRFSIYRYDDDKDTIYLADVFVEESIRGQGRGNEILSLADNIARMMGAKTICLKVKKDSFAHGWYARHGYSDLTDDEENTQFVWMTKSVE